MNTNEPDNKLIFLIKLGVNLSFNLNDIKHRINHHASEPKKIPITIKVEPR